MPKVAALKGGWAAWLQAGYPVAGQAVATAVPDEEAGVLGDPDAPVTIVEYSDYQCPYCRQYTLETMPQVVQTYVDAGLVRYVFRDFPLSIHPNARKAANAARCAGEQGRFWSMHERLFESQGEWASQPQAQALEVFGRYAADLGLDADAFGECVATDRFAEQIAQDVQTGQQAGIGGTPSFVIDGKILRGAHPFSSFQQMVEAALEEER